MGLEVERIDDVRVEIDGGRLVGDVDGVVAWEVPHGERLELGVARGDAALVLMVELGQARGELARAGAGRGLDDQGRTVSTNSFLP